MSPFVPIGKSGMLRCGKWGFIEKTGRHIAEPHFDEAWDFSDGLAEVNIGCRPDKYNRTCGGKTGYIDRTGKYVWKPTS
ncbi:MAG: WG repeat-containing protein [candidate division WOR-3 bacterium]